MHTCLEGEFVVHLMNRCYHSGSCLIRGIAAAAVLFTAGCGDGRPQRVPIAGKVLIDGQPLEQGFIQVVPANDRSASSVIGPDGSFRLTTYTPDDGCVLGNHRVAIIANTNQGATAMKWLAPKEYADALTSGLTLDVTEARDNVEINLQWNGGALFVETFANEGTEPPPE